MTPWHIFGRSLAQKSSVDQVFARADSKRSQLFQELRKKKDSDHRPSETIFVLDGRKKMKNIAPYTQRMLAAVKDSQGIEDERNAD